LQFVDLSTIAQVGATLAGFATLASAIRGTPYDSDAIFDVVGHSLLALIFALCASILGASLGPLRVFAALLAASTWLMFVRDVRVLIASARDDSSDYDRVSVVLGWAYMLLILVAPLLATAVVLNVFPQHAALLYESVLLAQIVAAALMLFDVVRRHLELLSGSPAARQNDTPDSA
jgi:hypothetical protein